jgi:acyl-CoA thioester hydrolase
MKFINFLAPFQIFILPHQALSSPKKTKNRPDMLSFSCQYRVRYADVDQMGYVYYGNYAKLYEIGRVETLRSLGMTYKQMEESGVMMPVYENKSRFLFPAKYDELLSIKVIIKELPKFRMVFLYEISNEENVLLHTGETTLVFVKMATNRLTSAPEEMLNRMKPHFGDL